MVRAVFSELQSGSDAAEIGELHMELTETAAGYELTSAEESFRRMFAAEARLDMTTAYSSIWEGHRRLFDIPREPVASRAQLSPLHSSQIRLFNRRHGADHHVEQEAVVDDDQEAWSALDRVGVLSDRNLGSFLVGA